MRNEDDDAHSLNSLMAGPGQLPDFTTNFGAVFAGTSSAAAESFSLRVSSLSANSLAASHLQDGPATMLAQPPSHIYNSQPLKPFNALSLLPVLLRLPPGAVPGAFTLEVFDPDADSEPIQLWRPALNAPDGHGRLEGLRAHKLVPFKLCEGFLRGRVLLLLLRANKRFCVGNVALRVVPDEASAPDITTASTRLRAKLRKDWYELSPDTTAALQTLHDEHALRIRALTDWMRADDNDAAHPAPPLPERTALDDIKLRVARAQRSARADGEQAPNRHDNDHDVHHDALGSPRPSAKRPRQRDASSSSDGPAARVRHLPRAPSMELPMEDLPMDEELPEEQAMTEAQARAWLQRHTRFEPGALALLQGHFATKMPWT